MCANIHICAHAHKVPDGLTAQRAENTVSGHHDNTVKAGLPPYEQCGRRKVLGRFSCSILPSTAEPLRHYEKVKPNCSSESQVEPPHAFTHNLFLPPYQALQDSTHDLLVSIFQLPMQANSWLDPFFYIPDLSSQYILNLKDSTAQVLTLPGPPCSPQPMAAPAQHLCLQCLVFQLCIRPSYTP